ncbi:MAG TPA: GGDEF domain-containing protein, partial [Kineosporiaceae bacterium]|nr:GGDEF domain-containing protein [Kineosporiaceae bacterium]
LLMRPDPVRLMMDGDPLADGARTAVLTAPIVSSGDLVGVLVSRRLSARAFTAYDEAAISRLAQACGARLPASPEREQLLADNMDRVTGLANRELLVNDLLSALAGMVAHGMPATLLVGEVDGLARLRTTQGSVAADVALAELAAKVRVAVRFGDVVYRSGGDELAVLLPATDEAGAAAVGQRLTRLAAGSFESTHPGLSLRTAAVDVEGSIRDVLARAAADLGAARIAERWAAGAKVV